MATVDVRTNFEANRLYIVLEGFLSESEIKTGTDAILAAVKKLKPGFDTISDIRGFKPATPRGLAIFKQAAAELLKHEPGRAFRVDNHATVGSMQFKRISAEAGYEPVTVGSVEEAERLLDEKG